LPPAEIGEQVDNRKRLRAHEAHADSVPLLAIDGRTNPIAQVLRELEYVFELVDRAARSKNAGFRAQSCR
jgi:hypothetical protein